ncbi:hypoxia induced protein conserved region-domain-containing protein [Diplogelasinospora grovesii]|uniref:Hypoxia induced protein conserved region-domain-containing protein n=1 Tax=Diplogelasinospora grovesii TaxID=303347 RepID=A0AAN6N7U3_9PEZI|nr:hypoxia induced protein conserved region-domain-containing protein [Diplogelasinospora grovesii]
MSDRPLSDRPLPSSFDDNDDFYNESGAQKVMRRLKQEPLVPIGCLLTVAAFTNAYRAMRRGDHVQVQRMFRARVAAQGFTVLAMVAGGLYYAGDRHKQKELWKLQQQQDAEEKRQKWIKELEARDDEEKALKERLDRRRKRAAERARAAEKETGTEGVAAQARALLKEKKGKAAEVVDEAVDGVKKEEGGAGVLGALGGWFGGGSKPTSGDSSSPSSDVTKK